MLNAFLSHRYWDLLQEGSTVGWPKVSYPDMGLKTLRIQEIPLCFIIEPSHGLCFKQSIK